MKAMQLMRGALLASGSVLTLASAPAFAEAADRDSAARTDDAIIVTARRLDERLQDVPISISVADQKRIDQANVVSTQDLTKVVSGLNVQSRYSPEQATFTIRGFSQERRTSSSVGTYFGDVVAPRGGSLALPGGDGAGPGSLFDLQSIQVLKGPQGTLFGRNTTGGAVLLVPRKPVDKFEGYLEGSYGNYEMFRIQGVLNVPVTPWARLRLGVDRLTRDGYLHNVSGIGPRDFGDINYTAVRGSLVLDLTPELENYTIVSYLHSKNNGTIPQMIRANPSALTFGPFAQPQIDRRLASGDRWQVEQNLENAGVLTKQFQIINSTTWIVSDSITLKNIMSYSTFMQDARLAPFGTNFSVPIPGTFLSGSISFPPFGAHTADQENFTEEFRVQGTAAGGDLTYQAGLYYEHSVPRSDFQSGSPSAGSICLLNGFTRLDETRCTRGRGSPQSGRLEFINMAAYAQGTYALTDQFKVTAGMRYTYDRTRGRSTSRDIVYNPTQTPLLFTPPVLVGCTAGFTGPDCSFSARSSDDAPTWTLSLQYEPTTDAMLYATYSRGYRQGSAVAADPLGISVFGPEKVDAYEAGVKTSFGGGFLSASMNLAGFYSELVGQQISVALLNSQNNRTASSILNVGKSRIYGFDFDTNVRFGDYFRLNGAATYVNSKVVSTDTLTHTGDFDVVNPAAVQGDPLPYTPKWTANVSGTFTLPVDESLGTIELTAGYRYSASYTSNSPTVTSTRSTPVKQLDLNFDWHDIGGQPIDLSIFANNVTNQLTHEVINAFYNSFGFEAAYLGQPRMYGVRLKVRFGD